MRIESLRVKSYRSWKVDDVSGPMARERLARLELFDQFRAEGCSETLCLKAIKWSRATYYRWQKRYREQGVRGLENRSRRPRQARPLALHFAVRQSAARKTVMKTQTVIIALAATAMLMASQAWATGSHWRVSSSKSLKTDERIVYAYISRVEVIRAPLFGKGRFELQVYPCWSQISIFGDQTNIDGDVDFTNGDLVTNAPFWYRVDGAPPKYGTVETRGLNDSHIAISSLRDFGHPYKFAEVLKRGSKLRIGIPFSLVSHDVVLEFDLKGSAEAISRAESKCK